MKISKAFFSSFVFTDGMNRMMHGEHDGDICSGLRENAREKGASVLHAVTLTKSRILAGLTAAWAVMKSSRDTEAASRSS
jgi:hypothetical protein